MRLFGRKKIISVNARKKDLPRGLWLKCPQCNEIVYRQEVDSGKRVCPKCSFHFQMTWKERLELLTEKNSFTEWDADLVSADPLQFTGKTSYLSKLKENQEKTKLNEAIVCGQAIMGTFKVAIGIMDFRFLGGSMGSVVGEKISRLVERATAIKIPVIIVCTSGGARMYEGMFSLMQMIKTSAALARHANARLLYISVLTHPTTAGVMASFATLGDVIIAEPHALIGFAGPRVIRETTHEEIPAGFQQSEFVLKHGLIDMIVQRQDLKPTIISLLGYMTSPTPLPEKAAL